MNVVVPGERWGVQDDELEVDCSGSTGKCQAILTFGDRVVYLLMYYIVLQALCPRDKY